MPEHPDIRLCRVYDLDDNTVGYRVLVDRLWPRGVAKSGAAMDEWLKELAPSAELRPWYGHDVRRFEEFARRYRIELRRAPASTAIARLVEVARTRPVILLTATRDVEHSGARVLHERLTSRKRHIPVERSHATLHASESA